MTTDTELERWQLGLRSRDAEERALGAENLSYLGDAAAFAAVDLVQACAAEDAVREWAVAALEEMGKPPVEAKAALAALATSPEPLVAYWAVTLLGRLGPDSQTEQALLLELLRNRAIDLAIREKAAWAVGQMGVAARSAIPVLRELREAEHPRLAQLAENAIAQLQAG